VHIITLKKIKDRKEKSIGLLTLCLLPYIIKKKRRKRFVTYEVCLKAATN
jgi:hypothetical protein